MVYYINESNDTSLDSIFNEFNLSIMEASHEYDIEIMNMRYNFLNENGYEIPINEAEEKKEGIFRSFINNLKRSLSNLKDKIIKRLTDFADNHPNNIIGKAIKKIKFIYKKADNDISHATNPEVAKKELKAASTDMNDTAKKVENVKEDKKIIYRDRHGNEISKEEHDKIVNTKDEKTIIYKDINGNIVKMSKEEFDKMVNNTTKTNKKVIRKNKNDDNTINLIRNNVKTEGEKILKYTFVDALDVDPTFEYYEKAYNAVKSWPEVKNFPEAHKELTPFSNNESDWDDDYWVKLKVDYVKNPSDERLSHMRKVAKVYLAEKIERMKKEKERLTKEGYY